MSEMPQGDMPQPQPQGSIVSVNSRGGTGSGRAAKVAFVGAVLCVIGVGALVVLSKVRGTSKATQAAAEEKTENKPAAVGARRSFDLLTSSWGESASAPNAGASAGVGGGPKAPQGAAPLAGGPGGRPLPVVPGINAERPIPLAGDGPGTVNATARVQPGSGTQRRSVYDGDVLLSGAGANTPRPGGDPEPGSPSRQPPGLGLLEALMKQQAPGSGAAPAGPGTGASTDSPAATQRGPLSTVLSASGTRAAAAGKLQNLELVIPKGRTIECALSMRLISDVNGMATCVLNRNVYGADGKVVLLERGSEAVGEYSSAMTQGQRRLFVLWTRVRTPAGVVIELNSPAADALGSSGLSGFVDNHWWERIGAAFMLSLVQDAVAYKVAESTGGGTGTATNTTGQNTQQTGQRIAEQVLSNSINIKPTLYRNQGDRGTIFVARDLDFGSVYALRPH